MKLNDWKPSDGADIESGKEVEESKVSKKGAIPAITEVPTFSLSEDGDSQADSPRGDSKLSTKVKVVRWYNNRGRVQKVAMVIGVIILCVALIAVAIWAATENVDAPLYSSSASEAVSDRDFNVPVGLSTASPTVSPPSATQENETTDNIMDNTLPIDDVTPAPVDSDQDSVESPTDTPLNPHSGQSPTDAPKEPNTDTSYVPGHLNNLKQGLILSVGLDARIIAVADEKVKFEKKKAEKSKEKFHKRPDAGATFELEDGGWIYVSNSEEANKKGGVGALSFDKEGNVKSYDVLLKGTSLNKGGGKTPFGTWVSCEENGKDGKIYQIDPTGNRKPEVMTIGREGGNWESFAYDIRDEASPRFFVTEDAEDGALQRFTPETIDSEKPWKMLHKDGTTEFLMLVPNAANNGGQFVWTTNRDEARNNAALHYPHTEGLDVHDSTMYFVCKKMKQLFVLDLNTSTYSNHTTEVGLFDGTPDQVLRAKGASNELLYFTEDTGSSGMKAGVHARDHEGKFYTVLESEIFDDETTGLSFSPDGRFMYIAYQTSGLLYAVWRSDGYPFQHEHAGSILYHDS
ncbi:MAG: hypothetical protein SGBAC_004263 [Bacillariaceae sp.]